MSKVLQLNPTINPTDLDITGTNETRVRDWRWLWLRKRTVTRYVFDHTPRKVDIE